MHIISQSRARVHMHHNLRNLTAGLLSLSLGLFVGTANSRAAVLVWTNTAGGYWSDPLSWNPNGVPGPSDDGTFNAAATYGVTFTNEVFANSIDVVNAANTTQTLLLDLNGNNLSLYKSGTGQPTVFTVGDASSSTSVVYLVSSTGLGRLYCTNSVADTRFTVGRSGIGTVYVTNVQVVVRGSVVLANGGTGRGLLVLSGPTTYWTNSNSFAMGNNAAASRSSLVVSNSASITVMSTFAVGGSASGTNSLLLDTGGRLLTRGGTVTVGNGAGTWNSATVQNGASWDNGNLALTIGGTGANNSLTIGATAKVANASFAIINAGNTLSLTGGLLQVSSTVTNAGTIKGFGTVAGNAVFTGAGQVTPGFGTSVGKIVFSNNLSLASGSTAILKLDSSQTDSNDQLNIIGTLTCGGTLTVVTNVPGALVAGDTYKILAFGGKSGEFSATNLPALNPSVGWDTSLLGSQGILSVYTVPVVPGITGPTNQAVNIGTDVIISATVTGVPAPVLQWQKDGTNLVGATSTSISLTNVQTSDGGSYCLIATNTAGAATNCMTLTVSGGNVPPSITGPTDQTVIQGNTGTFSVSVSGLPIPTVQWLENGTNVVGAAGPSLVLTNVQFSQNGFVYSAIASNEAGVATSTNATLTVIIAPTISVQPQDQVVTNTQSASFYVTASGVPAPGYQWYFNNGIVNNATNATYTIASATPTNAGTYKVVVANTAGSVTSSNATLTVNSTMSAALTPANNASNVCYDTPLYLAFDLTPVSSGAGKIKIFNATNNVTPVDTIDTGLGNLQARTIGTETFNTFPVIITGNTVAIYPHLGVLTSNQTYYVTVDPATFQDTNGALFAGITDTNAWRFTTKPTGPSNPNKVIVAADGSGDFCTVQGVIDSLPNGNTNHTLVNIRNGNYTELVNTRNKNHITLRGQSRAGTVVRYRNNDSQNSGTHFRMSFKVYSDDIVIENLTLINTTPKGGTQAEALMLETNIKRFILNNAEVHSFQDTILGNTSGTQAYFNNSLIEGDTDYIWGGMNGFFTNCIVNTRGSSTSITQPRTDALSNGMSFVNCLLTRSSNAVINTTLARALGFADANVAFVSCRIDSNVTGWTVADISSLPTLRWWEFGNTDLQTGTPVTYNGTVLTNGDSRVTLASIATNWLYGWAPQLAPNITGQPTNLTVNAGQTAVFAVSATGIPEPTYQWLKDGTNVLGTTSATLTIVNAQAGDAATYSVIVSNIAGAVTNASATLTVVDIPPAANFSASPTSGTEPLVVSFADTSTGTTAINLFWDLGDSTTTNTAGGASFMHSYAAGTYSVTMIASNALGTSTIVSNNLITVVTAFQAWQMLRFGCTSCPEAAAAADPDGDGFSNEEEFWAGTDPNNSASGLKIISVVEQGSDMLITWATAGGATNVVQATAGDANGDYTNNFTNLSGPVIVLGSGNVTTNYVDTGGATNTPARYFRIRLVP